MDRTALHRRDPAQDGPQAEIARAAVGVPVPFVQWGETIGTVTITEFKLGKRSASPALGPGPLPPFLASTIRFENKSSKPAAIPAIGIRCKGSAGEGDLMLGDEPTDAEAPEDHPLRPRQTMELDGLLSLPDSNDSSRAPECDGPAFVAVTALGDFVEKDPASLIRIPDELVSEMNAQRVP
jgi:hypothetical protein